MIWNEIIPGDCVVFRLDYLSLRWGLWHHWINAGLCLFPFLELIVFTKHFSLLTYFLIYLSFVKIDRCICPELKFLLCISEFGRYSGRVRFESGSPTENSALLIPSTEESDEGSYTCHISTFPNGNFERHIALTVWGKSLPPRLAFSFVSPTPS